MIYYQIVFYDGISLNFFGHKANVKCEMQMGGMCTDYTVMSYTSKYASDPSPDALEHAAWSVCGPVNGKRAW